MRLFVNITIQQWNATNPKYTKSQETEKYERARTTISLGGRARGE